MYASNWALLPKAKIYRVTFYNDGIPMSHLSGKSILLTRGGEQNNKLANLVHEYGATPILFPCLSREILTHNIIAAVDMLLTLNPDDTDIIFTSQNGVTALGETFPNIASKINHFRIVAVGKKTAHALVELGCKVSFTPDVESQLGLISKYADIRLPKHVVFFRAEEGGDELSTALISQGIDVNMVFAYRTECDMQQPLSSFESLTKKNVDAVLLGSAKTAECYVKRLNNLDIANAPVIIVMSQQVAEAADKLGLTVQVIAKLPNFEAMLASLNAYFASLDAPAASTERLNSC